MTSGDQALNTLSQDDIVNLSDALLKTLSVVMESGDLGALVESIALEIRALGIPVTRLQLPASSFFGFKHPFYVGIILTWTQEEGVDVMLRERRSEVVKQSVELLKRSPYAALMFDKLPSVRITPRADDPRPIIVELAERGYTDYLAFSVALPDGMTQVMSLATDEPSGFAPNLEELLLPLRSILGMCVFGAYQANTAKQIAVTYLGDHAGNRVLKGELYRGNSEKLSTLILFADIRNFTALSERVGAEKITDYVNLAFEKLNLALKDLGGEILKFIGDAALMVFPNRRLSVDLSDDTQSEVEVHSSDLKTLDLQSILKQVCEVVEEIRSIEIDGERPLDLGIGLHIGEVFYGNIGARDRLDFTVMGPTVNLAARLESLTKSLGVSVLFSEQVYAQLPLSAADVISLTEHPPQRVKGVSGEIKVWSVTPLKT